MLNSHTHCQVAPANTQAKTWQRVCLFQPAPDRQTGRKKNTERTTAVWRNGGCSASYDSFVVGSSAVQVGSFVLKIRHYAKPRTVIGNPIFATVQHQTRLTKIDKLFKI
jgi:hypothetical protein